MNKRFNLLVLLASLVAPCVSHAVICPKISVVWGTTSLSANKSQGGELAYDGSGTNYYQTRDSILHYDFTLNTLPNPGWQEDNTWTTYHYFGESDSFDGTPSPNPSSSSLTLGSFFDTYDPAGPAPGIMDTPNGPKIRTGADLAHTYLGAFGGVENNYALKLWFDYPRNTQVTTTVADGTHRNSVLQYHYTDYGWQGGGGNNSIVHAPTNHITRVTPRTPHPHDLNPPEDPFTAWNDLNAAAQQFMFPPTTFWPDNNGSEVAFSMIDDNGNPVPGLADPTTIGYQLEIALGYPVGCGGVHWNGDMSGTYYVVFAGGALGAREPLSYWLGDTYDTWTVTATADPPPPSAADLQADLESAGVSLGWNIEFAVVSDGSPDGFYLEVWDDSLTYNDYDGVIGYGPPRDSSDTSYTIDFSLDEELSDYYSTSQFVSDVQAAAAKQPVTSFNSTYNGEPLASTQISPDGTACTVTSGQYKLKFHGKAGVVYVLPYTERITYADGSTTDRQKEITMVGTGEDSLTSVQSVEAPAEQNSTVQIIYDKAHPLIPGAGTSVIGVSGFGTGPNNGMFSFLDNVSPTGDGNGNSVTRVPSGFHSLDANSQTLENAIDAQLAEGASVLVVGHSMGAFVAYNAQSDYAGQDVQFVYVDAPYNFIGTKLSSTYHDLAQGVQNAPDSVNWTDGSAIGWFGSHLAKHDPFDINSAKGQQELSDLQDLLKKLMASCACQGCDAGSGDAALDSVNFTLDLGRNNLGLSAGELNIEALTPALTLQTPAGLQINSQATNGVSWSLDGNGNLATFTGPEIKVVVSTLSPSSYQLSLYHPDNLNTPYSLWNISSPDSGHTLNIINTIGSKAITSTYTWISANNDWQLVSGNNLKKETKTTTVDSVSGDKTEVVTVTDPQNGDAIVSITRNQYHDFGLGQFLTASTLDPSGANLTTYYYYYDNTNVDAVNFGKLKLQAPPTGVWTLFNYNPSTGQLASKLLGVGNASPSLNPDTNQCLVFNYGYTPVDSQDVLDYDTFTPRTTTIFYKGVQVATSYKVISPGIEYDIFSTDPVAAFSYNPPSLVTRIKKFTTGDTRFLGTAQQTDYPNGTREVNSYTVTTNLITFITETGAPSGVSSVTNGTRTITTATLTGHVLSKLKFDIATGLQTAGTTATQVDSAGRPLSIAYLNGTTAQFSYNCCGLESEIKPDGSWRAYSYDDLKRLVTKTVPIVPSLSAAQALASAPPFSGAMATYQYAYDAEDRLVHTTFTGSDNSTRTLYSANYNWAGQQTSEGGPLNTATLLTTIAGNGSKIILRSINGTTASSTTVFNRDGTTNQVTGNLVHPVSYEYGVAGNSLWTKVNQLDAAGNTTDWNTTYVDPLDRPVAQTSSAPGNPTDTFSYNPAGQLASTTVGGVTTLYGYDSLGQNSYTVIDLTGDGQFHLNGSNSVNQVVRDVVQDPTLGTSFREQLFVWDQYNANTPKLLSTKLSSVSGYQHQTSLMQDGTAITTSDALTLNGSLQTTTSHRADGATVIALDLYGQHFEDKVLGANGVVSQKAYTYDAFGSPAGSVDELHSLVYGASYNAAGLLTQAVTPPAGAGQPQRVTQYSYNSLGQNTQVTYPDNSCMTNTYTPAGDLQFTSGARKYTTGYNVDAQGRLLDVTNWANYPSQAQVTHYNLEAGSGRILGIQPPNPSTGLPTGGTTFTYYPNGLLHTKSLARTNSVGVLTTTYTYDGAGRIATAQFSDGNPTLSFSYNRLGYQSQVAQGGSPVVQDSYDLLGNPTIEAYTDGLTIQNSWSGVQRTGSTLAIAGLSKTSSYSYSAGSGLSLASEGGQVAQILYTPGTTLPGTINFNSITTTLGYNNLLALNTLTVNHGAQGLDQLSYTLDSNDQVTKVVHNGEPWNYALDASGQVYSAYKLTADGLAIPGFNYGFTYDTIGNVLTSTVGGLTGNQTTLTYPNSRNEINSRTTPASIKVVGTANPQATISINDTPTTREHEYFMGELLVDNSLQGVFISITNRGILHQGTNDLQAISIIQRYVPQTGVSFQYDADGNLTSDDRWSYTWDINNRLSSVQSVVNTPVPARRKLDYQYDWLGRRTTATESLWTNSTWQVSNIISFVYDGWKLAAEINAVDNTPLRSYFWLNNTTPAWMVNYATGTTNFYITDALHNVVALVDSTGIITARYEYSPFGETIQATGPMAYANPLRFASRYQDSTGNIYYGLRYYSPSLQRWLSPSQLGVTGSSNYRFSDNNPTGKTAGASLGLQ